MVFSLTHIWIEVLCILKQSFVYLTLLSQDTAAVAQFTYIISIYVFQETFDVYTLQYCTLSINEFYPCTKSTNGVQQFCMKDDLGNELNHMACILFNIADRIAICTI